MLLKDDSSDCLAIIPTVSSSRFIKDKQDSKEYILLDDKSEALEENIVQCKDAEV